MGTLYRLQRCRWTSVFIVSLMALLIGMASTAFSQTVSLTASPTTGISPLTVTLNWSAAGFDTAAACTGTGSGFAGTKPMSGSATITLQGGSYTYSLTCANMTGSAVLNWTPPTQNTDNSTISPVPPGALAGFKLYKSPTAVGVQTSTPIDVKDPLARSYTVTGLSVGTWYFAAKAYNSEAIESAFTGNVQTVVVAPSATANATVTVNVQPKPPVLTVVASTAYDIQLHPIEGTRLARTVGTVPVGTECYGEPIVYSFGATYYEVRMADVALSKNPKTVVVAACEPV